MAINLFFKYALRSVGGNIEYLATSSMEWVAPNSCLNKIDNMKNSYDDHVPSDDSDHHPTMMNEEPKE